MQNEGKILKFDTSVNKYRTLAEKKIAEGDYFSALSFLLTAKNKRKSARLLADIAEVYQAMGIPELSINYWFKYLSLVKGKNVSDAYIGLATNYLSLGNVTVTHYYFEKFMRLNERNTNVHIDDELIDYFLGYADKRSDYKIVHPKSEEDYKDALDRGRKLRMYGELDKALSVLQTIDKNSVYYSNSLCEISIIFFLKGDTENAIKLNEEVLSIDQDNFFALCNLSTTLHYVEQFEKSDKAYKKLLQLTPSTNEETFMLATLSCEKKNHAHALKLFNQLLKEKPYNIYVMFLVAIAHYNLKNFDKSLEVLSMILRISEVNPIALYFYREIEKVAKNKDKFKPLNYFYRIPDAVQKKNMIKIQSLFELNGKELRSALKTRAVKDLIDWCFTCDDHFPAKVVSKLLVFANDKSCDNYLKDKLLDASLNFEVKENILIYYIFNDERRQFDITVNNVFKSVELLTLPLIFDEGTEPFVYAYAKCFVKFVANEIEETDILYSKTVEFYYKFSKDREILSLDLNTLSATLALFCGVRGLTSAQKLSQIFDCKTAKLRKISKFIKEE